jgi:hypothetical protein
MFLLRLENTRIFINPAFVRMGKGNEEKDEHK